MQSSGRCEARTTANQLPPQSSVGGGGGAGRRLAGLVSVVAAGRRLAQTLSPAQLDRPARRSFRFNDNGSMVDLRCDGHTGTFQRRCGTLQEDPVMDRRELGIVLDGIVLDDPL